MGGTENRYLLFLRHFCQILPKKYMTKNAVRTLLKIILLFEKFYKNEKIFTILLEILLSYPEIFFDLLRPYGRSEIALERTQSLFSFNLAFWQTL